MTMQTTMNEIAQATADREAEWGALAGAGAYALEVMWPWITFV